MFPEIVIQPFTSMYAQQVIDLILPIQQIEFGVSVTADDQPDLLNIPAFYFKAQGNFWIALHQQKLVGTIGLLHYSEGGFALRKMFVAKDFRGKEYGVAQALWQTAKNWVTQQNGQSIYLGTVEKLQAAIRFYQKNGFQPVQLENLPEKFPKMAVDTNFYFYQINNTEKI
jgi:GNAT superfamily N-acetyltransferase